MPSDINEVVARLANSLNFCFKTSLHDSCSEWNLLYILSIFGLMWVGMTHYQKKSSLNVTLSNEDAQPTKELIVPASWTYFVISCAQDKPCVLLITHPHATLSTLMFLAICDFLSTIFIVFLDITPHNSLKIYGLKLCCTNVKLFSKDHFISVCCNSIR